MTETDGADVTDAGLTGPGLTDAGEGVLADQAPADGGLWPGDTGTLREPSRRALVQLLRGPYVSADRQGHLWRAVLNDEAAIRSRLADVFLDLVVDTEAQVAFVRNADTGGLDAPRVVRSAPMTFMDTALVLHLRQLLLQSAGSERVIVGQDEVSDQLQVYRGRDNADPAMFGKRINASWRKLEQYGILARTSTEGRYEISPVLRLVFGAEEIAAVQAEYARLADGGRTPGSTGSPAGPTTDDAAGDDGGVDPGTDDVASDGVRSAVTGAAIGDVGGTSHDGPRPAPDEDGTPAPGEDGTPVPGEDEGET
ncbi:DUF4194 domain-containing protein [Georgenia sp. TF02-10]|uniref:DUF4194 domain-containing protein n=1 Tax=Georgenia sp. TF02-10 TaxID=2917725 RepID=UPI001FA71179|nr:DUF4194 domain-containing protein [Georgenia sp. TF02-10]UNX55173.1 DUF4194 domain-containing protein [Georgenia sp. TF02-10]